MTGWARYAGGAADWDAEYEAGTLDRLDGLKETARLGAVSGYAARLAPGGAVLDVGAGPAVLVPLLSGACAPRRYLGFDLSQTAVDRGRARLAALKAGPAEADLLCADLTAFEPGAERFDLIVFNEVLFFVDDAAGEIARYAGFLKPGGAIVVSLHLPNRPESGAQRRFVAIEAALDAGWTTLDAIAIDSATTGNHWRLRVLRPTSAPGPAPGPA